MKISVQQVQNFGRIEWKPNCEKSVLICDWLGKRHLNRNDLAFIAKLGFIIWKGLADD